MPNNEKIYTVVVNPTVNDRMAEHFEFLAKVSETAANRLLKTLTADIKSLQISPFRNPPYDRPYILPLKYRYLLSGKRYRIVYQIVEETVFVDDIQDCRQGDDKDMLT